MIDLDAGVVGWHLRLLRRQQLVPRLRPRPPVSRPAQAPPRSRPLDPSLRQAPRPGPTRRVRAVVVERRCAKGRRGLGRPLARGSGAREHGRPPLNRGSVGPPPEHGREPDRDFAGHDSHFLLGKDEPITEMNLGEMNPGARTTSPKRQLTRYG